MRRIAPLAAALSTTAALGRVTLAQVQGEVLILSGPDGPVMVFARQP